MRNILIRISNWKSILPFFILTLIFPAFLFPHFQDRMAESAGAEVVPLDSRFSYTYDEVKHDFDQLGADGRSTYRTVIAKVDNFFPLFYGSLFILVLTWLLKRLAGYDSRWVLLALFPCIGILFEYLENFNTLALLDTYPAIKEERVSFGSMMTGLKQIFLTSSVGLILLLAITLLVRNLSRKRSQRLDI